MYDPYGMGFKHEQLNNVCMYIVGRDAAFTMQLQLDGARRMVESNIIPNGRIALHHIFAFSVRFPFLLSFLVVYGGDK